MKILLSLSLLLSSSLSYANNLVLVERQIPSSRLSDGSWMGPAKMEMLTPESDVANSDKIVSSEDRFSVESTQSFAKKANNEKTLTITKALLLPKASTEKNKELAQPLNLILVKKIVSGIDSNGTAYSTTKVYISDSVKEGEEKMSSEDFNKMVKVSLVPAKKLPSGAIVLPRWKAEIN